MHFNKKYFTSFLIILGIEIMIAAFFKDRFVRPFLGDVLAVMGCYVLLKSFFNIPVFYTALGVFLFAACLELGQYLNITGYFGIEGNKMAHLLIGSVYDPKDILAYFIGFIAILKIEKNH